MALNTVFRIFKREKPHKRSGPSPYTGRRSITPLRLKLTLFPLLPVGSGPLWETVRRNNYQHLNAHEHPSNLLDAPLRIFRAHYYFSDPSKVQETHSSVLWTTGLKFTPCSLWGNVFPNPWGYYDMIINVELTVVPVFLFYQDISDAYIYCQVQKESRWTLSLPGIPWWRPACVLIWPLKFFEAS